MPLADLAPSREEVLSGPRPIGADQFPVLFDFTGEGHTMTAMDYMLGQGEYPLKGLVITAANPVVTHPDTRKVERAFRRLDLLVVNDFFMTRTARLAHYVLPAETFLERSEIHCNTKYHRVYLTRKVAEIPGIQNEYRLWRDLAFRLGFGGECFPWEDQTEVNRYLLSPTEISLEDLRAHPEGIVYQPVRFRKHETTPLPTPSGKVEFISSYLKEMGLSELPEYIRPFHLRERSEAYPFLLTTGARMTLFYHSRHQNIGKFRLVHIRAEAEIHPEDAAGLGIADGDRVRLTSRLGSIEVAARVVHRAELHRGVVEVYHGWEERPVNILTFGDVNDPISGFPLLKAVPVRIEKVAPGEGVAHGAIRGAEGCVPDGCR
jgi:anaerobic selenocysteine-containing dehydrogenase